MASKANCLVFFMLVVLMLCSSIVVNGFEYEVGGANGWILPKKDGQFFNEWASAHRFKVNDTVRFTYKKDSVIVVPTEEEYNKCRSSHPVFFSNNGDSVFTFDRPGLFYFISGVSGHCERGQKMIIKVLEIETPPAPADEAANSTAPEEKKSGGISEAVPMVAFSVVGVFVAVLGMGF
ncbi:hypothetical protein ACFE04_005656 [Oxalis oulophora]